MGILYLDFKIGTRDLNSGSHAWLAITVFAEDKLGQKTLKNEQCVSVDMGAVLAYH